MGVIKKLYGKELVGWSQDPNTEIYPITHVGGVYDSNGNTLESLLGDMNNRIDYGGGGSGSSSVQPIIYLWAYCTASDRSEAIRKLGDRNQQADVPRDFYADISQAEGNLKDNELIYMTTARRQGYNYMTWTDHYIWSVPIRMGNGETSGTGVDGDSVNYIYCRRRVEDAIPMVPNITVGAMEALSTQTQGKSGYDQSGNPSTVKYGVWYDHPLGISEDYPEEWVAIAEGNDPANDKYNTTPTLWSRWGFNGRDGDGTEYIFMRAMADASAPTWGTSYKGRIGETGTTTYTVNIANIGTDENYQKDDFIPENWHDEPQELNSSYPIQYVSIRKRQWVVNENESKWGPFSTPKVWSSIAETSGYSVTINNDAIILDDDTGADDVKNVSCTKVHIWEGTAEITNDATYDYDVTINQRNGADYYFGVNKVTAISNGAVTTAPLSDASFEYAYPKSALYTNNLGLVLCLTKENDFINKDFSIEYNIKIYKIVNGSRSAQPVAEVSRSQAVKVADFNNGAAYQLQVTPNSLPVFRETSESSYQFPTGYVPTITVTARKSMEGSVSVQQIHYPSEEADLHTGDMWVEVKGISFTGTETSSSYATPGTGSGALDSLTFKLGDAYTNCSAYVVNLKFVIGESQSILVDTETVDFTVQGDRGINGIGSYMLELDNDNAILDDNTVSNVDIEAVTKTKVTLKYGVDPVDSTTTSYAIKLEAKSLPDGFILKDWSNRTISSVNDTIEGNEQGIGFYLTTTGNLTELPKGDAYYVKVKAMIGTSWLASKTFGLKIKDISANGTVYGLNITNDSWSYESDNSMAGSAAISELTVKSYTKGQTENQSFIVSKSETTSTESDFVLVSPIFSTTTSIPEQSFTLTQTTYASNGYDVELYYKGEIVDSEHIDCVKNGAPGIPGEADAADFYTLMPIKMEALVGADDRLTIDVAFNIQYTHGSQQSLVYGTNSLPAGYSLNVIPYLADGSQYNSISYLVTDTDNGDGNGIWTFEDENTHTQKVIEVQTNYSSSNSQVTYFVARLTYSTALGVDTVKDSVNIPVRFANGVFFEINQEQRTITARIQESELKTINLLSTKADWLYDTGTSQDLIPPAQYAANPYRYESVAANTGDIYSPPILLPAGEYTVSVYSNEPKNTFKDNIAIALYGASYPSYVANYTAAGRVWSDPVENEDITIDGTIYHHYVTTFSLNGDNYTSINWYPQNDDYPYGDWLVMPQLCTSEVYAANFSSIIQKADSINTRVTSLETTIGDENSGLVKDVAEFNIAANEITSTVSTIRNSFGAENLFSFNEAAEKYPDEPYAYLLPEYYGMAMQLIADIPNLSWPWYAIKLNKKIEAGKYTFSMKIFCQGPTNDTITVLLHFQMENGTIGIDTWENVVSGWNDVSFTLDTADGNDTWIANAVTLNFYISSVTNSNGDRIYPDFKLFVHNFKMEAGEMATAFRISSVDENAMSQGNLIGTWNTYTDKIELDGTYNSMPVYKAACNISTELNPHPWRLYMNNVTVKDNTCYTISFWAKADVDGVVIRQNFYDNGGISRSDDNSVGQGSTGEVDTTLTTQWKHYTHYWYTDFASVSVATVDWGQNVTIMPGKIYKVAASYMPHRYLLSLYNENSSDGSFNMQNINDDTSESEHFSNVVYNKTIVGLQIPSTYGESFATTKYVYIAGLSFDEGYVGEGPSSSSSIIRQTANEIELGIKKGLTQTGINIDDKTIKLRSDNVDILGADGKPYIKISQDSIGMPHLIFYDVDGETELYDLGYTGFKEIISGTVEAKWITLGLLSIGDLSNTSNDIQKLTVPVSSNRYYRYSASYNIVNGQTVYGTDEAYNGKYFEFEPNTTKYTNDAYYAGKNASIYCVHAGEASFIDGDVESGRYTITVNEIYNGEVTKYGYLYFRSDDNGNTYYLTDENWEKLSPLWHRDMVSAIYWKSTSES